MVNLNYHLQFTYGQVWRCFLCIHFYRKSTESWRKRTCAVGTSLWPTSRFSWWAGIWLQLFFKLRNNLHIMYRLVLSKHVWLKYQKIAGSSIYLPLRSFCYRLSSKLYSYASISHKKVTTTTESDWTKFNENEAWDDHSNTDKSHSRSSCGTVLPKEQIDPKKVITALKQTKKN